jgi:predicted nuclease of predicted toxin-antitoxin system
MKLLLDANLSWRLSKSLKNAGIESVHVDFEKSLKQSPKDIDIWNFSLKNEWIILTNDEDFVDLAILKGFPPKIIILKTGNQSTKYLEALINSFIPKINEFAVQNEYGVLEIF